MKTLNSRILVAMVFVGMLVLQSCGGEGHGGSGDSGSLQQAKTTIGPDGGSISLQEIVDVIIPKDTLAVPALITVETIKSPELDQEFKDGNTGLGELDSETFHIKISGFPSSIVSTKTIQAKFKLSDALAAKISPTAGPAAAIWSLYSSEDEELAENQLLPSQYDSATKVLTVDIPISVFSVIDPVTRVAAQNLQAVIRVSLFELNPNKTPAQPPASLKGQSAKAVLLAAIKRLPAQDNGDVCMPDWQSPMDNNFVVNGPFSETYGHTNNQPHGGMDISAKEQPVRAVADGYIDEILNTNRASENGPIYTLILKLNNGDKVKYLHLKKGGIVFCNKDANGNVTSCLKDEPNIDEHWKDGVPGKNRYAVKMGDILATSGNTGAPHSRDLPEPHGYHLHIGYFPIGTSQPENAHNPLCRLAQLEASPTTIYLPATTPGDDIVSLRLVDKTGKNEYKVQRQKVPVSVPLPAAAKPVMPLVDFVETSRAVMLLTDDRTLDNSIAAIDPAYRDESITSPPTDNGKIRLLPRKPGATTLTIRPQIFWDREGARGANVFFGSSVVVQINNSTNAGALAPIWKSFVLPATTVASPQSCNYGDTGFYRASLTSDGVLTTENCGVVTSVSVETQYRYESGFKRNQQVPKAQFLYDPVSDSSGNYGIIEQSFEPFPGAYPDYFYVPRIASGNIYIDVVSRLKQFLSPLLGSKCNNNYTLGMDGDLLTVTDAQGAPIYSRALSDFVFMEELFGPYAVMTEYDDPFIQVGFEFQPGALYWKVKSYSAFGHDNVSDGFYKDYLHIFADNVSTFTGGNRNWTLRFLAAHSDPASLVVCSGLKPNYPWR